MARPNFLFIITDQHRADHLGCYGNEIVQTPHIDSLASNGTRFEKFYVANPLCMPNRASLMTGRMPSLHGVRCNGTPLSERSRTYVQRLKEEGYRTALIGKSHLQNMTGKTPMWSPSSNDFSFDENGAPVQAYDWGLHGDAYENENPKNWLDDKHQVMTPFYGFDEVKLCSGHSDEVGGDYERWLLEQREDGNELRGEENAQPDNRITTPQGWRTKLPEELYPTTYIGEQCLDYLKNHTAVGGDQPFFLQASFPDPHHPFTPPGKYWDMYDPADMPTPSSLGQGNSSMELFLRDQLEKDEANRKTQMPYAVNEREAREAMALTFGMITMIDDQIGRLLAGLEEMGLAENTVVIFTSDHGDYMGDHGLMLKGPLHLHGMINVPFIWQDPGIDEASVTRSLGQTTDISASILDRAGVKPYYGIQGKSLMGDISGDDPLDRKALLIEDDRQRINLGFTRFQSLRSIVNDRYRLTVGHPDAPDELYDLKADPDEVNNLWDDEGAKEIKADLMDQLMRLIIEHQDPTPLATAVA